MSTGGTGKDRSKIGFELLKLAFTVLFAVISTAWVARGLADDYEKRLTIIESKTVELQKDIVPRDENAAHWNALNSRLDSMQTDIREIRRQVSTGNTDNR